MNPSVYGFELAAWLSKELAVRNVITSYPNAEDWGRYLEYTDSGIDAVICCGSMVEYGTLSSGAANWLDNLYQTYAFVVAKVQRDFHRFPRQQAFCTHR